MKKIRISDVLSVVCFAYALSCINFDKEAVKAFAAGAVMVYCVMRRLRE
jgi:hypothetical protein